MKLVNQILECTQCPELVANRTRVVVGEGPVPCAICFLGEAPGREEDLSGIPFCGRAGNILDSGLYQAGLRRRIDVHILNMLKCRPPDNRNPKPSELKNCSAFLEKQLEVLQPKVIVAMGRYAMAYVLHSTPAQTPVLKNVGRVVRFNKETVAILTYHPAFLSRNQHPEIKAAFIRHLKLAKEIGFNQVDENEMHRMLVTSLRK